MGYKYNNKNKFRKFFLTFLLYSSIATGIFSSSVKFNTNIYDENDNLIVSENEIDEMLDNMSDELDKELTDDDLDYLMLYSAFSNNNLSDSEKDKIYNLIMLIKDNKYLDRDKAYSNLSNLKINYSNDAFIDNSISGIYNYSNDNINIYFDNRNYDVLYHELIHCIYTNNSTEKLPLFFVEGMAELLENEYFSEVKYLEECSYIYEIIIVKILCELTSPDNVLRAYSTGDINHITSNLANNCDYSLEEVNRRFMNIDKLFVGNELNIDEEVFNETMDLFKNVYENKINYGSFDSINCKYLINLFDGISYGSRYLVYFYNLEELGVSTKIYFNSSIKSVDYTYIPYNEEYYDNDKQI